jgi:hypothetical protein
MIAARNRGSLIASWETSTVDGEELKKWRSFFRPRQLLVDISTTRRYPIRTVYWID